jgi:NADPH:quinone reductase-like Zn-dependent oxidoreductase
MREAASIPLVFITAWEGLVDGAGVRAGQSVLIQGGAGGVGHVAIQTIDSAHAAVAKGQVDGKIVVNIGASQGSSSQA